MTKPPPLYLPPRATDAHKGSFGRVVLVGGSRGMCGSIALSSIAALRTGSGLVSAAVPDRCLETVAAFHPALMTIPLENDKHGRFALDAAAGLATATKKVNAVGCGPGMTTQGGSLRIVEWLVQQNQLPCVFDADAINCLSLLNWPTSMTEDSGQHSNVILSPHPGELHRLTGVPPDRRKDQIAAAQMLANRAGVVVIVKGGPTVVVGPAIENEHPAWTNTTGNAGMATAGSGDVLTGIVTSLLGQGLSTWDAARLGVWIHGRAGDFAAERHGQMGMTANELAAELPKSTAEAVETQGR